MGPSINKVPYELWLMIYEYLQKTDLKALSSCSAEHRRRIVRLLYGHIRLSGASVAAFVNGSFKDLGALVSEVTFDGLLDGRSAHETLRLCELYCASLGVFPNLIGVHVPISTCRHYERKIPLAIVRGMMHYPFYQNLRTVCFDAQLIDYEDSRLQDWVDSKTQLSTAALQFLTLANGPGQQGAHFLQNLEVASGYSFGSLLLRPLRSQLW
ncbi:hypothetical protein TWF481_010937 [Arthrobotrys musiformis]|uniref:F-box domain-containing protein n=1 Tax=Arthrobotrys musiformis TaxID=47236 RepID=A0AAV9VYA7_9PEZI